MKCKLFNIYPYNSISFNYIFQSNDKAIKLFTVTFLYNKQWQHCSSDMIRHHFPYDTSTVSLSLLTMYHW